MRSSQAKFKLPGVVPIVESGEIIVEEIIEIGDDINEEFKRQARNYAYISGVYAKATSNARRIKNELRLLTAELNGGARAAMKEEGETKPTKDQLADWVVKRKDFIEKQNQLEDALLVEDQMNGLVEALKHKKDMLVGLGANYRQEISDELRMMGKKLTEKKR